MKGEESPKYELIAPAIPSLARALMRSDMDEVITDISWGFSFLTRQSNEAAL